jgi:hypothetical protein
MEQMDPQQLMRILTGAGLAVGLILTLIGIAVMVFYLLTLMRALERCSPESRAMQPGLVWLNLIPCFNLVWMFFTVLNIAKSLDAEFKKRNIAAEPLPGRSVGLAMCILNCCSIIPYLGCLAGIGGLVCFIIYWIKIAGYSKQLASA